MESGQIIRIHWKFRNSYRRKSVIFSKPYYDLNYLTLERVMTIQTIQYNPSWLTWRGFRNEYSFKNCGLLYKNCQKSRLWPQEVDFKHFNFQMNTHSEILSRNKVNKGGKAYQILNVYQETTSIYLILFTYQKFTYSFWWIPHTSQSPACLPFDRTEFNSHLNTDYAHKYGKMYLFTIQ